VFVVCSVKLMWYNVLSYTAVSCSLRLKSSLFLACPKSNIKHFFLLTVFCQVLLVGGHLLLVSTIN